MYGFRILITFMEVMMSMLFCFFITELLKIDNKPIKENILLTASCSFLVIFMFRFEAALFGKRGFSYALDMLISFFGIIAYLCGMAMLSDFRREHILYPFASFITILMALLLTMDVIILWWMLAYGEDDYVKKKLRGSQRIVVARKNVRLYRKKPRKRSTLTRMLFYKPWKRYRRYKDPQEERERVKSFLRRENIEIGSDEKLDVNTLTPQQKVLWSIMQTEAKEARELDEIKNMRLKSVMAPSRSIAIGGRRGNIGMLDKPFAIQRRGGKSKSIFFWKNKKEGAENDDDEHRKKKVDKVGKPKKKIEYLIQ